MGDYLGSYRQLRVLMTGQTSQIWEVMDDRRAQKYAMKHLINQYREDREHLQYLRNEYDVGKSLNSPRLIKMHEYLTIKGGPYVVMELYPHPNLKQRLSTAGIDWFTPRIEKIITGSAEALSYLHQNGWVHRDVKPDNFLSDEEGNVKMIDFGLTQKVKTGLAKMFAGKTKIQGTMSYLSPEQIRGQVLDQRADLYSFGCMIFEILAGRFPFVGVNSNELLQRHLTSPPPPLEATNSNVTTELSQLLIRMLAKQPEKRPESMAKFLTEFKSIKVFKKPPR